MTRSYNDDEPILAAQDPSGQKQRPFLTAKTNVNIINNNEAPLKETNVTVLLELTGAGSGNERSGVDIVMVLDISENMKGNKLEDMKTAMQFLIRKLSPIDRLSVVTVGKISDRLCALRQMTEKAQSEIEESVNALSVVEEGEGTNISAGLQTAVKVIKDRILTGGRVAAIMLMSSGEQTSSESSTDPTQVPVSDLPVHTFGFGNDYNPKVLNAIANKSNGGTFSIIDAEKTPSSGLTIAFSQCLAGLLTVAVQDLKLTVTTDEGSIISNASAGVYLPEMTYPTDSVTVSCGNLYSQETRKVVLNVLLPTVNADVGGAKVLDIKYEYRVDDKIKPYTAPPLWVNISRTKNPGEKEAEEVRMEETRIRISKKIIKARELADKGEIDKAQTALVEAQCDLEDVAGDKPNPLINMLRYELLQFLKFVQTPEIYEKKGRAFALASETSHTRQRFAARGHAEMLRMFATPRMDAYLEQANSFVEDPSKPLPTTKHDAKKELAADPLTHIVEPLLAHINESLKPYFESNINSVRNLHESLAQIQLLVNTAVPK